MKSRMNETTGNRQQGWVLGRRLFLAGLIVASTGCQNIIRRSQSPDEQTLTAAIPEDPNGTHYIGDVCGIWGLNFAKVQGIGLAVGLDGTGSNPAADSYREHLERELKSRSVDNVTEMLSDDDTSLVILRGILPPAIRKGERFDVEVKVAPNSETASLEGARLMHSRLRPMARLGRGVKEGHVTGFAKGDVFVDALFEARDDRKVNVHGWILGGGIAVEDRPIGLTVRSETSSVRTTSSIARAINNRFSTTDKSGKRGVATAKTDRIIELVVPIEYKHNVGRFLQAIQETAFDESPVDRVERLERLGKEIAQPAFARAAALRLEAIGEEAIPTLRRAARHEDLEVKFYASQALAYLGETSCVENLQFIAEHEPAFRWHCLTALASMNQLEAGEALGKLMHVNSAETRYGAFRAMRARSPHDPMVQGDWLAKSFFFHVIPSETEEPMIHFSRSKRPEITLFGHEQTIGDDFLFVETGLTVRAIGNGRIQITSFTADGEAKKTCSNRISDLVRTLASLGFDYGDQINVFQNAKKRGQLDSRLVINAVPRIRNELKPDQANLADLDQSGRYVTDPLPELFRTEESEDRKPRRNESLFVETGEESKKTRKNTGRWSKIKDWFSGGARD